MWFHQTLQTQISAPLLLPFFWEAYLFFSDLWLEKSPTLAVPETDALSCLRHAGREGSCPLQLGSTWGFNVISTAPPADKGTCSWKQLRHRLPRFYLLHSVCGGCFPQRHALMGIFSGSHPWGQTVVLLLPVEPLTSQLKQSNGSLFALQHHWYGHRTARKQLR